jgi:hypothetical protein
MKDSKYMDHVNGNSMEQITSWIESGEASKAVNELITALQGVAEELAQTDCSTRMPEVVAHTSAYLTKIIADLEWLKVFANGKPDSRPSLALIELRPFLTDNQFYQLDSWIKEAQELRQTNGRLV